MKRLADLTIEDLVASPVWRYEGGSGTEALVAAARRGSLSQTDDEILLAATEFELFDSTRHFGFCFPADGSAIDYLQPAILTKEGQVAFWFDGPASPEVLSRQWSALGKEPGEIFPVAFRCLVPVDGREVSGRIDGVECSDRLEDPPPAGFPSTTRRRGIGTSEIRAARRRPAEMTVEFSQGARRGTGVTGDVSRRGMFVRSTWIPGAGPLVRLTVSLPGGRKLALTGRVVRGGDTGEPSPAPSGFGIRLLDDWPDYEELFKRRASKK